MHISTVADLEFSDLGTMNLDICVMFLKNSLNHNFKYVVLFKFNYTYITYSVKS